MKLLFSGSLFVTAFAIAGNLSAAVQAPKQTASQQFGTALDDNLGKMAVDDAGNCFMAGNTKGEMAGKNACKSDVIVAKYNAAGERQWLSLFGTSEDETANAIIIDDQGNTYIVGETKGKLGNTQFGDIDAFVAKIDASGKTIWLEQFGSNGASKAQGIARDVKGNLYVTGGISKKPAEGLKNSPPDVFVSKIDKEGHCLWTREWGTGSPDTGNDIAIDPHGNLYVTGQTAGTMDGQGNAGKVDIFVTKLDAEAKVLWSKQFGTAEPDTGMHLLVDAAGCIYVSGSTGGDLAGTQIGQGDSVLIKLSNDGDLLWKKQFGTSGWDGIHKVILSIQNNGVIVSGCQAWDKCEGFLREFDFAGNELWQTIIQTDQNICGQQVGTDAKGNIYQSGLTHASAFAPYTGTGNDCVLVKYTPESPAK